MKAFKIILNVMLFVAGIALLGFLGWLGYKIYEWIGGAI